MKLTELLVCIAIFLLASSAFLSSYVYVRKSADKVTLQSIGVSDVISTDICLRKQIQKIDIPYWKNLKTQETSISEQLKVYGLEKGIDISNIEFVYDQSHCSEGIKIDWKKNGKTYVSQEFIKQRFIDEIR